MSNSLSMHRSNLRSILFFLFCASALLILCSPTVLHAGVGGGVEGKEKVDIIPLVKWTLVFLAGLGTVFGVGIAFAAKRFAVQIDPRVEKGQRPACARSLRGLRLRGV